MKKTKFILAIVIAVLLLIKHITWLIAGVYNFFAFVWFIIGLVTIYLILTMDLEE